MTAPHRQYESHIDFYQSEYGSVIQRVTPLTFATLLQAEQSVGDWSDLPTPDLVLGRVAKGQTTYSAEFGAGRFGGAVERNHSFLVAPNTHTSIQVAGLHTLQGVVLPFARLKEVVTDDLRLPDDGDFGALHARPLASPLFSVLIGAMFDVADPHDPAARLFFDNTLLSIVAMLVLESGKPPPKLDRRGGLAPWQVRRVTDMMAQADDTAISLVTMADAVGLSTYHFCRAFKHTTGHPPHRYQTHLRLNRAKALLANTQLSILEVALSVGYDSQQGLARLFRRELGVTPSQYRQERAGYLA